MYRWELIIKCVLWHLLDGALAGHAAVRDGVGPDGDGRLQLLCTGRLLGQEHNLLLRLGLEEGMKMLFKTLKLTRWKPLSVNLPCSPGASSQTKMAGWSPSTSSP